MREMQTLVARKNKRGDAQAAAGAVSFSAAVDVPAAAVVVRQVRAGDGQGDSGAARVAFTIPIRTGTGLNDRGHWRVKARKVKAERQAAAWSTAGKKAPPVPCTVLLARVGPSNGLDDDNLRGSLKGVRDELAKWLGVDDRSPLVAWAYEQRRGKEWGVEVTIA